MFSSDDIKIPHPFLAKLLSEKLIMEFSVELIYRLLLFLLLMIINRSVNFLSFCMFVDIHSAVYTDDRQLKQGSIF